tara:strand:- start:91 stop:690 length:600 start_codon:yes stop_codon:yes gene_type:complete
MGDEKRGGNLRDLLAVTVGVLIALMLDGAVGWAQDRMLVAEARDSISREVAENKDNLTQTLQGLAGRTEDVGKVLQLIEDLVATGKSDIDDIQVGLSLAELSRAAWETANRTGALQHMGYEDVRGYARVYEFQERFINHQSGSVRDISAAIALIHGDPRELSRDDLMLLRQALHRIRADFIVQRQLGDGLLHAYSGVGQ